MTRLEKLLYATGLAYILSDTYGVYALSQKEGNKLAILTAKEYSVDFDNVTEEDAKRIKDNLLIQMESLKKELLEEETD
jgi:hypothetical protein